MRHLLAYMFSIEAKEYHLHLSDQLAKQFRLKPVSSRIDPHITLKAPFDTDDISEIQMILESFVKHEKSQSLTLEGINYFPGRVVYIDVRAPKQTHMLIRRLQDQLRNISWLSFHAYEFPIVLHATLCYAKNSQQQKEILSYLKKQKTPKLELKLDNVTLLEKRTRWEVAASYPIEK